MSVAAPLWFWKFRENNSKFLIFFVVNFERYGVCWKITNRIYKEGANFDAGRGIVTKVVSVDFEKPAIGTCM